MPNASADNSAAPSAAPQLNVHDIKDQALGQRLAQDVAASLAFAAHDDEAARAGRIATAVAGAQAFDPRSAIEAHLIVQMAAAHNMAAELMRQANAPDASPLARAAAMKFALRFMGLFQDQLRSLDRHRAANPDMRGVPHEITVHYVPAPTKEEWVERRKHQLQKLDEILQRIRDGEATWEDYDAAKNRPVHDPEFFPHPRPPPDDRPPGDARTGDASEDVRAGDVPDDAGADHDPPSPA